jgi:Bacterial aa3 type cytochrome c oxidase subunit IV
MADHSEATAAGPHPEMDYQEHERTYERFLIFTKWSIIVIIATLILMAIFLL